MKSLNLLFITLLIINSSCGYFLGDKHLLEFECNQSKKVYLMPPEGTHKCVIRLNEDNPCFSNSETFLLINSVRYKLLNLNSTGVLFSQDWYDMQLGIEYVPTVQDSLNGNDNKITLHVTFYY